MLERRILMGYPIIYFAKTGTRINMCTMKHAMNLSQSKNTILSVGIILQVYGILCSTSCRSSHG